MLPESEHSNLFNSSLRLRLDVMWGNVSSIWAPAGIAGRGTATGTSLMPSREITESVVAVERRNALEKCQHAR